jgi:hypothetical protein
VAESDKISAVRQYLSGEFESCTIDYRFDSGQMAHVFEIKTTRSHTAIVKNEFLEAHSAQAIPAVLGKFLFAEHLRECNFPIVVTNFGLTD